MEMIKNLPLNFDKIAEMGGGLQDAAEAKILYDTASAIHARNILEIGSMYGTSSIVLGTVAKEQGGHLQCIDPWARGRWYENIAEMGLRDYVTMIHAFSPWIDMSKINLPIDYLSIDGEHLTRWCLVDYHYWSAYVRPGGQIAFHDFSDRHKAGFHVKRAVDIILEDDADNLREVTRNEDSRWGIIVFEKGDGKAHKWPFFGGHDVQRPIV